jgi:hypothetical protein
LEKGEIHGKTERGVQQKAEDNESEASGKNKDGRPHMMDVKEGGGRGGKSERRTKTLKARCQKECGRVNLGV